MGWVRDLLLESPVPPGNYLPDRQARLSMGRAILRGGRPYVPSGRLRDLGSAHPLLAGSRVVGADSIAAELEADLRALNPPITQGWMLGWLTVATIIAFLVARSGGGQLLSGLAVFLVLGLVLGGSVVLWSRRMQTIELHGDNVVVRSWLAARLGRPGYDIGPAEALRADLDGTVLRIEAGDGPVLVATGAWPTTARDDIADKLPIWGLTTPWNHRLSRRAERDERRAEAIEQHRADEEARSHDR